MAREIHVVMFPWLAFGHLIPFLQLSIQLAKAGIKVSFISTPRNIQRLPKIPPKLDSLIKLVEFHLPKVDNLPEGAEATMDVPIDKIQYLKSSYDLLHPQFRKLISSESPDWIIQDFAPYWASEIANEFKVPQIMFNIFSSVMMTFLGPLEYLIDETPNEHWSNWESLTSPPKWYTFPSSVAYRKHEAIDAFAGFFKPNSSNIRDCERIALAIRPCQAVAVRACREYEGQFLDLAEKILNKAVIPVGILPHILDKSKKSECQIFKWLDQQKHKSVVYVAFGSEVKLTRDQVHAIAHGLELADLPFFWALRKPKWVVDDDDDALPSGFLTRTANLGMVCMGWAPQWEILAHPSIGGSLFHTGWGSVSEALQHGLTLVVLPIGVDQGLNARLLVEKGLAVEVDRREEDGSFDSNDVTKALRKAMADEEGESIRVKSSEMKSVFGDEKLQYDHYMGGFVKYLTNNTLKQTD